VNVPRVLSIVCAWCWRVMRVGDPGAPTSHGICPTCSNQAFESEDDTPRPSSGAAVPSQHAEAE